MQEKWYSELVKNEMDGLVPLLKLFKDEEAFYLHFVSNTLFFKVEHVKTQREKLALMINGKEKFPVRYSEKSNIHFHFLNETNARGFSVKKFKNRTEAKEFSSKNNLYFTNKLNPNSDELIKVIIDKDGNYAVRDEIKKHTGYRVSQGVSISDFSNYMICHVWGKTTNPMFFTSLWNVTLIPNYLSFITDKTDKNSAISRKIKLIIKAICYELYKPIHLSAEEIQELEHSIKWAKIYIENNTVKFLENKKTAL